MFFDERVNDLKSFFGININQRLFIILIKLNFFNDIIYVTSRKIIRELFSLIKLKWNLTRIH